MSRLPFSPALATAALAPSALAQAAQRLLLRAAFGVLRALGPVRASDWCGCLARVLGPHLPVSRTARDNLRRGLPSLDEAGREAVVAAVWDNLGRTVGEFAHLPGLREGTPDGPGWEVQGAEILQAARDAGRPVLFVSGHIGNWEVLPVAVAAHGLPFASLYRAASSRAVDEAVLSLRRQALPAPVPMFPKGAAGARGALAHLRAGGNLGMLADQKMNDGIEARFFGRRAMTAPALAALALRLGCTVIPGHVQRLGPARLRVVVDPPLPLPDTGDRQADILSLTQAINDRLETWIRDCPGSWLWLHRRWPRDG